MAIREILHAPNNFLRQISKPVEKVDDELRRLMDDMLETMYHSNGIGLAAIQIGVPLRVIVMDIADKENPEPRYFVNPVLSNFNNDKTPYEEGCLSVPGFFDNVERPLTCDIEYLDYHGNKKKEKATGLFAVCIQHEMDHLEGILFIDYLSRLKRERIIKKLQKMK